MAENFTMEGNMDEIDQDVLGLNDEAEAPLADENLLDDESETPDPAAGVEDADEDDDVAYNDGVDIFAAAAPVRPESGIVPDPVEG